MVNYLKMKIGVEINFSYILIQVVLIDVAKE